MTSIAAVTAAALLAGLSVPSLGAPPAAGVEVTYQAPQVVFHGETGTYDLAGGVVVRRGAVVLRARSATVDPSTGEVRASGDVLLMDATRVVHAEAMHAFLDGPFEATRVDAFFKEKPFEPIRITSLAEARRGRNRLTLSAERVEGEDEQHLTLHGARFTLCDCGEGKAPTWELTSGRATVEGDRVALHWPVFRVTPRILLIRRPVPVLILPWLSLPLTDRMTGLLFPEVGTRTVTGWGIGLPVYVTLGRSADLTATPEYFFGPGSPHQAGGAVKGPGARLELRWAPAERAEGSILWHVLDDEDRERPGGAGAAGLRLSVEGNHRQDLGPDTRLVSHLALSQDAYMFRDFPTPGLPGDAYYSRSDVLVSRRAGDWVLEGGAMYLEPLSTPQELGSVFLDKRPRRFGWFGVQAPTLQRWPSAGATLLPVRLGSTLQLEGRVGLTRYAPLVGSRGELLPSDPGANPTVQREGVIARIDSTTGQMEILALPREAVTRSDARLQLSAPMLLGRAVSVEPYVRGTILGYAFDATRGPTAAGWGVAGISTAAEVARRFGALEHRIVPRIELLAGTGTWRAHRGDPFPAYDLWDRIEPERLAQVPGLEAPQPVVQKLSAAPDGGYAQLRTTLENRFDAGKAGQLQVQVGQDLNVRTRRLAETSASMQASKGPFAADAVVRFLGFGGRPPLPTGWNRSWLDSFTRLHVGAALHDARGDNLRASLDSTGAGAVGAEGAGVDALFDLRPSGTPPDAWFNAGARAGLRGASLDYAIKLAGRDYPGQIPVRQRADQDAASRRRRPADRHPDLGLALPLLRGAGPRLARRLRRSVARIRRRSVEDPPGSRQEGRLNPCRSAAKPWGAVPEGAPPLPRARRHCRNVNVDPRITW